MSSKCEITGANCMVEELGLRKQFFPDQIKTIQESIKEARDKGDVTDYSGLEKMTNNYKHLAEMLESTINTHACATCPYRTRPLQTTRT